MAKRMRSMLAPLFALLRHGGPAPHDSGVSAGASDPDASGLLLVDDLTPEHERGDW